jgi:hypothetical protein
MAALILIHPPVAKPCEPPGGIAKLAGALKRHGLKYSVLDANLEGLLALIQGPAAASDRWTVRAFRHRRRHLQALRTPSTYGSPDRYRRAVADINRLVETAPPQKSVQLSLSNYQDTELSALGSADLLRASRHPENNPFYPYFKGRLAALFEKEQPHVVGFSMNYLSQALCTFAMLGFIRRQWPELTLVVGGGLMTSWMQRPGWNNPFGGLVDHLVCGPGEAALLRLLGVLEAQASGPNRHRPDYGHFPLADYLAPGPILPYSASTGCYWNRCAFCPEKAEGNPYAAVPPAEVIEDLEALVDQARPALIHLLDNAVSPALMQALMEQPPQGPAAGRSGLLPGAETIRLCDVESWSGIRRPKGSGRRAEGNRPDAGFPRPAKSQKGGHCRLCLSSVRNALGNPGRSACDPGLHGPTP